MAEEVSAPTEAAATTTVVLAQLKDPGTFCGTDNVDIEDWLSLYERASKNNRWDETIMLANLLFYLKGTAKVWFENNEDEIGSWDACKEKMRSLFGKSAGRKAAAKKELTSRAQTAAESYLTYIQDVLALCRKADDGMTESEKVGHVLKGIADDAFNLLICKDCDTIDAIIEECKRFEAAKSRRIAHNVARLPNTAATWSCEDVPEPSAPLTVEHVKTIIRRELDAVSPAFTCGRTCDHSSQMVPLVQAIVHQELSNAGLDSVRAAAPSQPINRRPSVSHAQGQRPPFRTRNPAEWRTADDRPICFNCRRIGHVARHCNSRWHWYQAPYEYNRRPDLDHGRFQPYHEPPQTTGDDAPSMPYRRSPSPRGHQPRSPLSRRQSSRSPQFRRPTSPTDRLPREN